MIYLHPASSCSPERVLAVQAATSLTAVIDADGRAILQAHCFSPTAPGQTPPADTTPGAAGVFCEGS